MLTLEQLKKEYIDVVLNATGLPFFVHIDTEDFQKAIREYNTVTEYINGLLAVTGSSMEYAGSQQIASISTELKFIVRVDDDRGADGAFANIRVFRDSLSEAFKQAGNKFSVETTENGETKNYTVVAAYTLPATGTRSQITEVGDCISFTCSVYFVYMQNVLNTGDIHITIDGEEVNFLAVAFSRRPIIVANLYSESEEGESAAYAESAAFIIDLTLPAFISLTGGVCARYIYGLEDANTPHTVNVTFPTGYFGSDAPQSLTKTMIFGESRSEGQGIENVRYTVSLIPYATVATTGD